MQQISKQLFMYQRELMEEVEKEVESQEEEAIQDALVVNQDHTINSH